MKIKPLNGAWFFALCAVFTAALCVAYELGRADEGSAQVERISQEIIENRAKQAVPPATASEQSSEEPIMVQAAAEPEPSESEPFNFYRADVPLSWELQEVLREACEETNISFALALGLIEIESNFDPDAVSDCGAYGLMQLNPAYFPPDLDSADNIRVGMSYLADCIERYGDLYAGLVAYNQGSYMGTITQYAKEVIGASERWMEE